MDVDGGRLRHPAGHGLEERDGRRVPGGAVLADLLVGFRHRAEVDGEVETSEVVLCGGGGSDGDRL